MYITREAHRQTDRQIFREEYSRAQDIISTYSLIYVSCQAELAAGIFLQANAAALIRKSLTEIFTFSFFSRSFNSFLNLSGKRKEKV